MFNAQFLKAVIGCKLKQNAEGCNSCASLAGLVSMFYCMFYFTCDRSLTTTPPSDHDLHDNRLMTSCTDVAAKFVKLANDEVRWK